MTNSTLEEQQLGKLWELYLLFRESGDKRGARRLFKLLEKNYKKWHAACFCGHFSAGKSTLLNTLLSEDLLPTSPVPTSGNLVRLEPGPELVRVMYKDGESAIMHPPYNATQLKEWCKNTEEIDEVRIQMGDTFAPDWMLFDTPGVDATDRLHQAATEDAVFLADTMIYVADYNHIQSEANFEFLDRVQRLGKPIYLIVNQIDKHQEDEIPFTSYSERIEKSLQDWGLNIERIFYISLTAFNHPENQWEEFKAFMTKLAHSETKMSSLDNVLDALLTDHREWWKTNQISTNEVEQSSEDLKVNKKELQEKKASLENDLEIKTVQDWIEQAKRTINRTIESAVLMPYETRELAKNYLESMQPEFKVGFFSTKAKVQNEQQVRLNELLQNLQEKVNTLNWQTADTFYKTVESLFGQKDELKRLSQGLSLTIDEVLVKGQIHEGARITGTYLLNFADQLAGAIQKAMRQKVTLLLEDLKDPLTHSFKEHVLVLQEQLDDVKVELSKVVHITEDIEQETYHFNQIESLLNKEIEVEPLLHASIHEVLTAPLVIKKTNDTLKPEPPDQDEAPILKEPVPSEAGKPEPVLESSSLREAAGQLKKIKGLNETGLRLIKQLDRLENQQLTVALFGAFSAGKSSFANALLGDSVLKVSPHPTTAVVNRILPVDEDHPHGQMILYMKTEEALLQDIRRALTPFGKKLDQLDQLPKVLASLPELGAGYSKGKLYLAFLEAVIVGLKELRSKLGQPVVVGFEEGQQSVADETKACLIDRVDLYFDCEATRKGLILVDTPGADSLNARHTETSYKYIKNADAVVFVTYYQHAFSRADETFLRQLGRIQDAFDRDKFFFIVNAIDLARNEDEKKQVLDFVQGQLRQLGMTTPRLFGVSSLEALKAKKENNNDKLEGSGFTRFYDDWERFVKEDLIGQTLLGTLKELNRSATFLDEFIEKGNMTESERLQALEQMKNDFKRAEAALEQAPTDWMHEELQNTIEELFYYVKQRVTLLLTESFSRFFNPSVLRNDRGSKQSALSACLEECIQFLSNELEQETHSTSIRIESQLTKLTRAYAEQVNQGLGKDWELPEHEPVEWTSLAIPYEFISIPRSPLEKLFKLFKNPKQFFEENGIKVFKEKLLEELKPEIEAYVSQANESARGLFIKQVNQAIVSFKSEATAELHQLFAQKQQAFAESKEQHATFVEVREALRELSI
jgi:GTPase Era involved in 16S rRNA processing